MGKRASLTPKQRADMLAAQDGKCAKCGAKIDGTGKTCIGEHTHPVALGNAERPDCLLCLACADVKTNGTPATTYGSDKHAIAKAKRLAKGPRERKGPAMKSRGFSKRLRKRMNGKVEVRDG